MTPAPERAGAVTSWRTLWRLRPFIAPHASSVWVALLLLIGSAGLDLLKPWPLKFIFDGVLGRRALDGTTIDLLVPILALVVAIAAFAGLFGKDSGATFLAVDQFVKKPGLEPGLFGLILVLFILFEPLGIHGRSRKLQLYFSTFPLYKRATFRRQKTYMRSERLR